MLNTNTPPAQRVGSPVHSKVSAVKNVSSSSEESVESSFFGKKTSTLRTSVLSSLKKIKNRADTHLADLKSSLPIRQESDGEFFKIMDKSNRLDAETAEKLYNGKKNLFSKCYFDALIAYIKKNPDAHFSLLKGYEEHSQSINYSFKTEEKCDGSLTVRIPVMPTTFKKFSEELQGLLHDHGSTGTLAKQLIEKFKPLQIEFDPLVGLRETSWLVRMTKEIPLKKDAEIQGDSDSKDVKTTISEPAVDSERDEKIKKELIKEITKLLKHNTEYYDYCNLSQEIAELHLKYDKSWSSPVDNLRSYGFHQSIAVEYEKLEGYDNHALLSFKQTIELKNSKLQNYSSSIWDSFPSSKDDRPLIRFKETYTVMGVIDEAIGVLENLHGEQRQGEPIKKRLFASRYDQEQEIQESTNIGLLKLQALGNKVKGYNHIEGISENSAWFMNLVGECLRQGMPDSLFQVGKIKISSGFRKAWKEKLMEWGIERMDKVSSDPDVKCQANTAGTKIEDSYQQIN